MAKSAILLKRIIERLERHDIADAVRALGIDEAAFRPLEEALRPAFNAGGIDAVSGMPTLTRAWASACFGPASRGERQVKNVPSATLNAAAEHVKFALNT